MAKNKGFIDLDEIMWEFVRPVVHANHNGPVRDCPICLADCIPGSHDLKNSVVELSRCHHQFHLYCLNEMIKKTAQPNSQRGSFLRCPYCNMGYGKQHGNQPPGTMNSMIMDHSLPGYENTKTIQITYHILPGIQKASHPNPGQAYSADNFPRICYLPDSEKGRLVHSLLKIAFKRRLTFTVGRSLTTGLDNVVVWNGIPHKTEWKNRHGHGYPDDGYLDRCLKELDARGVKLEDLK